jgi:hypothetical protein
MDDKKNRLESEDGEIAHLYAQIMYEQEGRDALIESFEGNKHWYFSHIYKRRVHLIRRNIIYVNEFPEKFTFNMPYTLDTHES